MVLEVLILSEDNSPLVCVFELVRVRVLGALPAGGGGGKAGAGETLGEALPVIPRGCSRAEYGSGVVMAALTGVDWCEESVSGDVLSDGEVKSSGLRGDVCDSCSRRGEYGGGGEATGSVSHD